MMHRFRHLTAASVAALVSLLLAAPARAQGGAGDLKKLGFLEKYMELAGIVRVNSSGQLELG